MEAVAVRVRLRFAKVGKVRFTSHRDVVRMWERALRRARVPVVYTAGFSPRPKLSFGLALSTGHESLAEYLDVDLANPSDVDPSAVGPSAVEPAAGPVDMADLAGRLSRELPVGIDVLAAEPVQPGQVSLQEAVRSCTWRIEALGIDAHTAERLVAAATSAETLFVNRQRKGRDVTDDLRPAVLSVAVVGTSPVGTELEAELAVHPRSVRPRELLDALAPGLGEGRVVRTAQWIWRGDERGEPLAVAAGLDAISAPHAPPCVSRRDQPHARTRTRSPDAGPLPQRAPVDVGPGPGRGPALERGLGVVPTPTYP